jgi:hypothetical protein
MVEPKPAITTASRAASRAGTAPVVIMGRRATVWAAVSGLAGTCMLIISFSVNAGPPIDDTGSRLTAFEQQHFDAILWGAWLQAIGPVFIVLFAFTIVRLADGMTRVTGWMTLFGATTLMIVNLVEIVGYIGALHTSPATMADISFVLIRAAQHLYFIIAAPALFLPLGLIILGSDVLPRILGYLAIVLAAAFALAGVFTLLDLTVPVGVQVAASVQVLWWLTAAITFIMRLRTTPSPEDLPGGNAVTA